MEDTNGMRKKFWNKELSEKIRTNANNMLEMKTNIPEIFNINDQTPQLRKSNRFDSKKKIYMHVYKGIKN